MTRSKAKSLVPLVVAIGIALPGATALACGESLFRVGKGVAYREYSAPLPGRILVVANTEHELALVKRLAAAGHDVHMVSSVAGIDSELAAGGYDIVMTLYAEHQQAEAVIRRAAYDVTYLPVAHSNSNEEAAAKRINPFAPSTDDSVKNFLKSIHRTLKAAASA